MKAKKCGVFATLAAVLLITAALIASCAKPVSPEGLLVSQQEAPGAQEVPEGMALLKLKIGGEGVNARTILPGTPAFTSYTVSITPRGTSNPGSTTVTDQALTVSAGSGTYTITEGDYTVTVKALINGVVAAEGTDDAVEVDSSGGSADIALTKIPNSTPGAANGTFKWALTLPQYDTDPPNNDMADDVTTATITVTTYAGSPPTTVIAATSILGAAANNTIGNSLAPGYYTVKVALGKAGRADYVFSDILHIYPGQTSTLTKTFPPLAVNEYSVTYTNRDGTGTSIVDPAGPFPHGGLIPDTYDSPTNTATPSLGFGGWYTDSAATTDKWVFASRRIIKNTILYARWNAPISLDVDVAYTGPQEITPTFSGGSTQSIAQSALAGTTVTITLTNVGPYTAIKWIYDGDIITDDDDDDDSLTFELSFANGGNIGLPVGGQSYPITLIVEKLESGDTVPYSGILTINVTP